MSESLMKSKKLQVLLVVWSAVFALALFSAGISAGHWLHSVTH